MERPVSMIRRRESSVSFDSTRSPRPAYQAIRARALCGSSHLIGRAATTMNHSDIRGLEPHDHDSSGAASRLAARVRDRSRLSHRASEDSPFDVGRSDHWVSAAQTKAGEFAGDGGDDMLFRFAARGQPLIAAMQALLRRPGLRDRPSAGAPRWRRPQRARRQRDDADSATRLRRAPGADARCRFW